MSPVNPRSATSAGLRSVALAALCALLWSPPVRAEPAAGRQSASDRATTAEARRHFQQGRQLLDAGSYAGAIAEFETALSLQPSPELLFNIAQAHRLKGDTKQALETYKRFIELRPSGPVADEARGHIDALTRQIEADERAAQAREAEQQREQAERQRQEVERQRKDAERQREDAERQRYETERQRYETEREEQSRRRRNGEIAVGVGVVLCVTGIALLTAFDSGDANNFNTVQNIGAISLTAGLLGLIPAGTVKMLLNPDPGPFKPTPTISKGVAFTFSF
jgi:tetratricopeptide (TPR) repeat protein